MRTSNSIKNSLSAFVCSALSMIISFFAQALFIKMLGTEYLGLNGVFSNILSMLGLFEIGIGSAIVFNLYKPIAENDRNKIGLLMNFYKKAYRVIATIIFFVGIILLPFIEYFVGKVNINININIVYLLYLTSTVTSYFMAYKRNLIIANQKNYIINIVHAIYLVILNFFQIMFLYITRNYYFYLIIKIVMQLLENMIISIISNKMYSFLENNYQDAKLDKETKSDIFKRVKALIYHKIGSVLVLGTDNIIISKFLGLTSVGLYTNYNTIITALNTLFSQIISTSTAGIGNLMITSNEKKKYDIFKKMRFLNSWISIFTSTCFFCVVQTFIQIWLGNEYKLDTIAVGMLTFNYFQKMQRQVYITFKDSAGIWVEDRIIPLLEAGINIVFSVIFVKMFGISGVFLGTIVSGLALWCYSYPKFIYKGIFKRSYKQYAFETLGYIILFLALITITYSCTTLIPFENVWIRFAIQFVICILVPNVLLVIIFRKSDNFIYFCNLIKKIFLNISIIRKKDVIDRKKL